jgi:hypothetical protein
MAIFKKIKNLKSEENTGYSNTGTHNAGRFFDRKTGAANVRKTGVSILDKYSWYHTFLEMPRAKFLLLLLGFYVIINLIFACIYYSIGIEHLAGIERSRNLKEFSEVFFFSTQTFTTVGYGRISPTGFLTSAVSTFEAFLGLLSFAIATGLFYGRFSRPRAYLKFSDKALIAPYKNGKGLMLRLTPFKNNSLSELEAKLTLAMEVEENEKRVNKFYNLSLQIANVNTLSLSWTLVHPIDEQSPLYGLSAEDISKSDMEILVFIKAFDEVFSNTVVTRFSYTNDEIVWGAKFNLMFRPSTDRRKTILDISLLNEYENVELPTEEATTT